MRGDQLILRRLATSDVDEHAEPMRARRVCRAWRVAGDVMLRCLRRPAVANKWVTDTDIVALVAAAPYMQRLDISYCYDLSGAALEAIARGCLELQVLDVSYSLY